MERNAALLGKSALVTGAGTGIGRETALEFGRRGADVAVHYCTKESGAASAMEELRAMGRRAVVLQADLGTVQACYDLVDSAVEFLGSIDVLVNNAGISLAGSFLRVTPQEFDLLYNVNVRGEFFCAQGAVKHMLERGQGGCIINMTSVHGCSGYPGYSVYDGTKGAIWAWTRQLAVELAPLGIRVNGVAPGWIVVARNYQEIPGFDPEAIGERMIPYKRLGKPIDVARACVYLASDDADYVVGQVLIVDGGVTAKTSLPLETLDAILGDV